MNYSSENEFSQDVTNVTVESLFTTRGLSFVRQITLDGVTLPRRCKDIVAFAQEVRHLMQQQHHIEQEGHQQEIQTGHLLTNQ